MPDRIGFFRFGICSIFHGQDAWKTVRVFGTILVFGNFLTEITTFSKMFCTRNHLLFQDYKRPEASYRYILLFRRLRVTKRVTKECVENGTNSFSLITFDGIDVQLWCIHRYCSKFDGRLDRRCKFWICSIFDGQNAWKTERMFDMTWVFGDLIIEPTTFPPMFCAKNHLLFQG